MNEASQNKDGEERNLSSIWQSYLETTSAHSLSRVPLATTFRGRLYWYLLFVGAMSVGCYQSALLVLDFAQFPVVMNIKIQHEPRLLFPSVTLCNQNRLMASKVKGTRFEDLPDIDKAFCACRYIGGLAASNTGRRKKRAVVESCVDHHDKGIDWDTIPAGKMTKYREKFAKEYASLKSKNINYSDGQILNELHRNLLEPFRKRVKRSHVLDVEENDQNAWIDYNKVKGENDWWGLLNATTADNLALIGSYVRATAKETLHLGHGPEDFIVQCSFDNAPCSYKDFKMFQHKKYGNCYTFNHGTLGDKLRYTSRTGSTYGLKVTLFIDQAEYIGFLSQEAGVRAVVHRPYTVPFPEDEGFDGRPGTSTTFGIRQHEIHLTRLPYGGVDCMEGVIDENYAYDGAYSLMGCKKSCIQRQLLKVCNCIDDINTLLNDAPICNVVIQKEAECVTAVYRDFENDNLYCECDEICKKTYYSVQYSSTLWPSDQHEGYLYSDIAAKSGKIAETLKTPEITLKNIVRLNFNYMELNKETLVETNKYEIWDLLSSVGGSMGLYVGISIVSLTEFVELLLKCVRYCFSGKKKSRISTPILHVNSANKVNAYGVKGDEGDTQLHIGINDSFWLTRKFRANSPYGKRDDLKLSQSQSLRAKLWS